MGAKPSLVEFYTLVCFRNCNVDHQEANSSQRGFRPILDHHVWTAVSIPFHLDQIEYRNVYSSSAGHYVLFVL